MSGPNESTPTTIENPIDVAQKAPITPVGPDGMTDYIRRAKADEIQGESRDSRQELLAEILAKTTSTPDVSAPNEIEGSTNITSSVNPGIDTYPNPSGNVTSPGVVPQNPF